MEDLDLILQEYVATANDPEANGDWGLINSKFPELTGFDPIILQEYVKTANDPKANGDWDLINSKFPEFESKLSENDSLKQPKDGKDFSSELPQVTMKDVDVPERQAINRLKKMYGGLGFDFAQNEDRSIFGYGTDAIIIIAPPDKDGNRAEKEFEVDLDLFGFSTKGKRGFWGPTSEQTAKDINDFIKSNLPESNMIGAVNEETYSTAWNYANTNEVSFKDTKGNTKKIADLSSDELITHVRSTYTDIMSSAERLPGVDRIFEEINSSLESFAQQTVKDLQNKYDTSDPEQYKKAVEEYNTLVAAEQDKLFEGNQELKNVQEGVWKALESRFNTVIEDKMRKEAEDSHLPGWITSFDSDYIRQAYVTAGIKFPKAWAEKNILHDGIDLKNAREELEYLQGKDPNATWNQKDSPMEWAKGKKIQGSTMFKDAPDYTNADRIEQVKKDIFNLNKSITLNIASQEKYQQKLKDIRVPTIFGKDISDPDLTIDEWQGMLGDQTVQMITALFTGGGSTYVQEGGGAGFESIEIEAARKTFPNLGDEAALKAFYSLPNEDTFTDDNVKMKGRASIMQDILNNGEVDLYPAVGVGIVNAGLEFVSTVFVGSKAIKFMPKSLGRDLLAVRLKQFVAGGWKTVGKDLTKASFMEFATEISQEATSIGGVGVATGYYGSKDKNLKRLAEAGGQALLSTGPLVGAGKVTTTSFKEIRARIQAIKDPNATRNAINKWKAAYNEAYEDGEITLDKRDEIYTELEALEDFVNETKYKELDANAKVNVIRNLKNQRESQQGIGKLEEENKKLKEESPGEVGTVETIQNEVKINELKQDILNAAQENKQELHIKALDNEWGRFAEHVNSREDGDYANAKVNRFETQEEALAYFEKLGYNVKNPKTELEQDINKFIYGQKDPDTGKAGFPGAMQVGENVYGIRDNSIKEIKSGGVFTSNAFHHDVLHVIQEKMPFKQLKKAVEGIQEQLLASGDPALVQLGALAQVYFKARYGGKYKRTEKGYYLEQLANLSDVLKKMEVENINLESGATFSSIGKLLGGIFHQETKLGLNWKNFDAVNAFEYLKKYTKFMGQREGFKVPLPKGKVNVQEDKKVEVDEDGKGRFSEIYQETNKVFDEYRDVNLDMAADLAASMLGTVVGNRLFDLKDKGIIKGFDDPKDRRDIVDDFISDEKTLKNKQEQVI